MRNSVLIFLTLLAALSSFGAQSPLCGRWDGALNIYGQKLRLVFNVQEKDGNYSATLDSPDQGARDIPVGGVSLTNGKVNFSMPKIGAKLAGKLADDGKTIDAEFSQSGTDFPLELKKSEVPKVAIDESILGSWGGMLNFGAQKLRIVFNITQKNGDYFVTADSPDQNGKDMPVFYTTFKDGALSLEMPYLRAKFAGNLAADKQSFNGVFTQFGSDIPLELKKAQ